MAAYLVANITIRDAAAYDDYRQRVPEMVARHGGRFIVRGGAIEVKEGVLPGSRLVVLEFPDMDAARAFYHSADYAPLLAQRIAAAEGTVVLVEGYTPPF
jgi:uncharacterized protein (DUF1330 family)